MMTERIAVSARVILVLRICAVGLASMLSLSCVRVEVCEQMTRAVSMAEYYSAICPDDVDQNACERRWIGAFGDDQRVYRQQYSDATRRLHELASRRLPSIQGMLVQVYLDPAINDRAGVEDSVRNALFALSARATFLTEPCRGDACLTLVQKPLSDLDEPIDAEINFLLAPLSVPSEFQPYLAEWDSRSLITVGGPAIRVLAGVRDNKISVFCDVSPFTARRDVGACVLAGFKYPCLACLAADVSPQLRHHMSLIREGRDPCRS